MAKLFISYRRSDSQHAVDRLYRELARHVGDPKRDIFMDVDNIPLGVDFVDHLSGKVGECETLLCVIGPDWLAEIQRRESDKRDFVRIEIEAALARGIPVVPLLLDGAPVPGEDALPPSIRALSRRNGTELRRATFDANVETLARGLGLIAPPAPEPITEPAPAPTAPEKPAPKTGQRRPFQLVLGGALAAGVMVLVGVLGVQVWRGGNSPKVQETSEVSPASAGHSEDLDTALTPTGRMTGAREVRTLRDETCIDFEDTLYNDCSVRSATFSPDGRFVVAGSQDGTAKLWEASTGRLIHTLEGHGGSVRSAAFSPDGRFVLTGSWDNTAKLWEAGTGRLVRTLEGHGDAVYSAAFSPDGRFVVTGSGDNTAKLWEAGTGRLIHTLEGHGSYVYAAAFSPDGRFVVTGSYDNTAKLWEGGTGRLVRTLEGHESYVFSAAFSPDGRLVVTGSYDNTAKLWDGGTGRLIRTLEGHGNYVYSAAFSPDGRTVVTGSSDSTAKLWETGTGRLIRTLEGHVSNVLSAAFSPDGRTVVTGSGDGTAKLWVLEFD